MKNENWDLIISPKKSILKFGLKSIYNYKDLLFLLVKRDFVAFYKQTILGPIWFFVQPILSTLIFTIIFGKIAQVSTDGIPHILFYLSGIILWNYFSDCLNKTSDTFIVNQDLFGKIYFPRIIVPLSIVINSFFKFLIQLMLLIVVWIYFYLKSSNLELSFLMFFTPLLILNISLLGIGFGIIISSLTTKYRDLRFLIQFGVQLLMYASPIVYPLSIVPEKYKILILLNPMTSLIEFFKFSLTGNGVLDWMWILYSSVFGLILVLIGLILFNKIEKSFIDTV